MRVSRTANLDVPEGSSLAADPMPALTVDTDVRVPTRDGVALATTLFRPQGPGRWPAVLMRTPYDRTTYASEALQVHASALATAGYAVVLQDVRGRGGSEGRFSPFVNERNDGIDTVEWLAEQSWCTGAIGLAGISYNAFAQTAIVTANHPAVQCWVPGLAPSDVRTSWIRQNGVFDLGFHLSWALGTIASSDSRTPEPESLLAAFDDPRRIARRGPYDQPELASTSAADWFFEWARSVDPYPDDRGVPRLDDLAGVTSPALVVAGWFDVFSSGSLGLLSALRRGPAFSSHRLVAGPWDHTGLPLGRRAGDRDFGRSAAVDLHGLQLAWFDQHLRGGDEVLTDRVFVTGRNSWLDEQQWPPLTTDQVLGLGSDGSLRPGAADGRLEIVVDANDPTPAAGGGVFPWDPHLRPGAFDQRARQSREDVALFVGAPLESPVVITDEPRLDVTLSGEGPVCATLVEITQDGPVWNVSDGFGLIDHSGVASLTFGPIAHEFSTGSAIGLDLAFAADPRLQPPSSGRRVIELGERASLRLPEAD